MRSDTESELRRWLKDLRQISDPAIKDAISRCKRVEKTYGDLDELFDQDRIDSLLEMLQCSPSGKPRHSIRFREGADPINGTASLRSAVSAYRDYKLRS